MPNTDAERLAALQAAVLGAFIEWAGDTADLDDCREASAHVAAVLTAAGAGFVAEAPGWATLRAAEQTRDDALERLAEAERERDEWAFDHGIVEHWQERAERAEAALGDLRSRVRALADEIKDPRVQRPGMQRRPQWADRLRVLLDTEADQ